jgi:hypothetical protein
VNNVFYDGIRLNDVSTATFHPIENGSGSHNFGMDEQEVFFLSKEIPDADPETFTVLWQNTWEGCSSSTYSKDKKNVYFHNDEYTTIVNGANIMTFKSLSKGFGKDSRGYYEGVKYLGTTMGYK